MGPEIDLHTPSYIPSVPDIVQFPISHHKERPAPPNGIIVHSMGQYIEFEGEVLFAADFLERIGLSAHYLIDHTGKIYQCVEDDRQAYHAGESRLGDETGLNKTFIGPEILIEGTWTYEPFLKAITKPEYFTSQHYESLGWLCRSLIEKHGIQLERIARHSDVSGLSVRPDPKYDPGDGFNFHRLIETLNKEP